MKEIEETPMEMDEVTESLKHVQENTILFTICGSIFGAAATALPSTMAWLYIVLFSNLEELQLLALLSAIPGFALAGGALGGVAGNYIGNGPVKKVIMGAGAYLKHCQALTSKKEEGVEEAAEEKEKKVFCRIC